VIINIFYLRYSLFQMIKKSINFPKLNNKKVFLSFLIAALLFSCRSGDSNRKNNILSENIYFDYSITAEEGDDNLTIKLQYREDGENGYAITLTEPGKVEIDGELIPADSSRLSGTYYEIQKPIEGFSGKHKIVYTNNNGEKYSEEFDFSPVILLTHLKESVKRDSLVFDFEGLDTVDYMRVVLSDTSFLNYGINRLDTVRNGRLFIPRNELEKIATGPVKLEFIREIEKPLQNVTEAGGKLSLNYVLRREFFLTE